MAVVVPVTTMLIPEQGLGVGVGLLLLQLTYRMIMHKEDAVIKLNIFFINICFSKNVFGLKRLPWF